MSRMNYKAEVKKMYPTAKCYNTGTILHSVDVYHIGVEEDNEIHIIVPSHQWSGNRSHAWKTAYEHIELLTTALGVEMNVEL